jgi:hypothetical protein
MEYFIFNKEVMQIRIQNSSQSESFSEMNLTWD